MKDPFGKNMVSKKKKLNNNSFQETIFNLQKFWSKEGCAILQPYDLDWNEKGVKYKDVFHQSEMEFSKYNFEFANIENLFKNFDMHEFEARSLAEKNISLPAYDHCLKASHVFNILDARGAISVAERADYISRIRNIVKLVAEVWIETQKN